MVDEQNGRTEIAPKPTTPGVDASLADRFSSVFPWMPALSLADQEACARDLAAAGGTGRPDAELIAWQETAAAVAGLGSTGVEWLDEGEAVKRPES